MQNEILKLDVLVVVALPEEMAGFEPQLPTGTFPQQAGGFPIHTFVDTSSPAHPVKFGIWVVWEMGSEEILLKLQNVIRATSPSFIANVGIAGMMSGDARIGDVVIAADVDYYAYRGAIDDAANVAEAFKLGGKIVPCHAVSFKEARDCAEKNTNIWEAVIKSADIFFIDNRIGDFSNLLEKRLINRPIKLHFGPICSGPFVCRSALFKKRLLERNRNLLCVEMEAAGVAMVMNNHFPNIGFLIVKGVSDPGDENKKLIDTVMQGKNRQFAVQNAFETALEFIRHRFRKNAYGREHDKLFDENGLESNITTQVIQWFLPPPYRAMAELRQSTAKKQYENLSRAISLSPNPEAGSPVSELAKMCSREFRQNSAYLSGRPGTGKTSLMCLLYLHCLEQWEQGKTKTLPILLGIRPSIGFLSETQIQLSQDEQLARIETILTLATTLHQKQPSISYFVLLDSGEAETDFVDQLRSQVRGLSTRLPVASIISGRTQKNIFGGIPAKHYSLNPIRRDKGALRTFCAAFLALSQRDISETLLDKLTELLWTAGLEDFDLFDASIGLQLLDAERDGQFRHVAFALEDYSKFRLLQLGVSEKNVSTALLAAANFALGKEHKKTSDIALEQLRHPERSLVRAHPRIHDFLVAKLLITELSQYDDKKPIPDALNCVYPQRINRITKELMCVNGLEKKCIENAIGLMKRAGENYRAKAFAAYLLGRTKKPQLREIVKSYLSQCIVDAREIHAIASDSPEDHEALLYARTVYITLAYLGDHVITQEYVSLIVKDKRLDEINRGFHLEYFGDQKYEVNLPLQNRDRLEDCPLTYERLFARLSEPELATYFEIELQTLCSLAVQRHANNKLSQEFRDRVKQILKSDHVWEHITNPDLADFLHTVEWCIDEAHLSAAGMFQKFLAIKEQKRSGWVKRKITPCESVADHTTGAVLIGLFFLPDKSDQVDYDKNHILRMLCTHDLGEAITGDILPDEKGDPEREREERVFRQLRFIGVVPGLLNQEHTCSLYQEFEANQSSNARIAKDIDRLEMLFQLYRYKDEGRPSPTHNEDAKKLGASVQTKIGREILQHINNWRKFSEK